MLLSRAVNRPFLQVFAVAAALLAVSAAHAQVFVGGTPGAQPNMTPQQMQIMQQAAADYQSQAAGMSKGAVADALAKAYAGKGIGGEQKSFYDQPAAEETLTPEEMQEKLQDHDSPQYKSHQLAKKAKADMNLFGMFRDTSDEETLDNDMPPPPEMDRLQNVRANNGGGDALSDDAISKEIALDLRKDAQKEAALSYGARGGLAKRSYQLVERLNDYESSLDSVFNFRQLLIKAPSGLMIEPPIVHESMDATVITEGGVEAAVADQVLRINKQARIVTAPRDWRQYLVFSYESEIPPPPKILWPKNAAEQAEWNDWVAKGWEAGYTQGEDIFESNLNKLVADYSGMVRYRTLLAEGKISQPFALQEDRGVTGGQSEMRVGDRALRITGPSEFLTGANVWKPADR